jgi:hypothetical protein
MKSEQAVLPNPCLEEEEVVAVFPTTCKIVHSWYDILVEVAALLFLDVEGVKTTFMQSPPYM